MLNYRTALAYTHCLPNSFYWRYWISCHLLHLSFQCSPHLHLFILQFSTTLILLFPVCLSLFQFSLYSQFPPVTLPHLTVQILPLSSTPFHPQLTFFFFEFLDHYNLMQNKIDTPWVFFILCFMFLKCSSSLLYRNEKDKGGWCLFNPKTFC